MLIEDRRNALKIMGSTALIPFLPTIPFTKPNLKPYVEEERFIIDAHHEWVVRKTEDFQLQIIKTSSMLLIYDIDDYDDGRTFLKKISGNVFDVETSGQLIKSSCQFSHETYHVFIQYHEEALPRVEFHNVDENYYIEFVAEEPGIEFPEYLLYQIDDLSIDTKWTYWGSPDFRSHYCKRKYHARVDKKHIYPVWTFYENGLENKITQLTPKIPNALNKS